jgi:hypothetical protein
MLEELVVRSFRSQKLREHSSLHFQFLQNMQNNDFRVLVVMCEIRITVECAIGKKRRRILERLHGVTGVSLLSQNLDTNTNTNTTSLETSASHQQPSWDKDTFAISSRTTPPPQRDLFFGTTAARKQYY